VRLGPYELLDEIGRGGLGAVYRARGADGRIFAIKVLLNPGARLASERFERETRLLAELGDGFVPILDQGSAPQGPYLVMPLLEGGTLRDRLNRRGALGADETLALARTLAGALGRAHAAGIVHRDLKPENVLYTLDGRALVADLGMAKHFDESAPGAATSVSLSKTGMFRGTPGYMALEQMRDAKHAGPPADVFALGAILHECLSGESAFAGSTPLEVIDKVERGERRALSSREAPRFLLAAIERALEPHADERFADASAFAAALEPSAAKDARARRPRALVAVVVVSALAALGTTTALVVAKMRTTGASSTGASATGVVPPDDGPVDLPPPGADLPRLARGFARSKRASLARVLGSWAFRGLPGPPGEVAFAPDGGARSSRPRSARFSSTSRRATTSSCCPRTERRSPRSRSRPTASTPSRARSRAPGRAPWTEPRARRPRSASSRSRRASSARRSPSRPPA